MDSFDKGMLGYICLLQELERGNGFACVGRKSNGSISYYQFARVGEDKDGNMIFFKK